MCSDKQNVKRTLSCLTAPTERCLANCTMLLVPVIGMRSSALGERQTQQDKQCVDRRGD